MNDKQRVENSIVPLMLLEMMIRHEQGNEDHKKLFLPAKEAIKNELSIFINSEFIR